VRSTPLRLAIGNIHRPGALTPSVVLSLGLGLALLVTLALIDTNLRRELSGNLPERAPNFFFVDIQSSEIDGFRNHRLRARAGRQDHQGADAARTDHLSSTAKRSMRTMSRRRPAGCCGVIAASPMRKTSRKTRVWLRANGGHRTIEGEPLVSFSAEEAGEIGLSIGDTITVSVLGRSITARIANLREVEWESLSINFVMVFSPNTFAGAPHSWMATLSDPGAIRPGRARCCAL
jgi:putative ABC transport system permease protein